MNYPSDSRGPSNTGSTLIGFALGAFVGAGLAILLAPDSGRNTRERISSTARRWSKDAGDAMEHAREAAADLTADAKSAIRAGGEAFAKDRAAREKKRSEEV